MFIFLRDIIAVWLPTVFWLGLLIFLGLQAFIKKNKLSQNFIGKLIMAAILFRLGFLLFLVFMQYFAWSSYEFGRILLTLPLDRTIPGAGLFNWLGNLSGKPNGYFWFYCYGRFFINFLLTLALVFAFYIFGILMPKIKIGFLSRSDLLASVLALVIVGWPAEIIFILILLIFIFIHFLFTKLTKQSDKINELFWPIAIATIISLFFANRLIVLLGWQAIII